MEYYKREIISLLEKLDEEKDARFITQVYLIVKSHLKRKEEE